VDLDFGFWVEELKRRAPWKRWSPYDAIEVRFFNPKSKIENPQSLRVDAY